MVKLHGKLLDGDACRLCGFPYREGHTNPRRRTRDHILPRSRGGVWRIYEDTINLRPMCAACNQNLSITGHCIGAFACVAAVAKDTKRRFGFVHKAWHMGQHLPTEMPAAQAAIARDAKNSGPRPWEKYQTGSDA